MTMVRLEGEAQQTNFGRRLGRVSGDQALIFLEGDLGAGKTTLVRGFLSGRGYEGRVRSPTYTLIEPYELPNERIYHLDLYRLGDPEELEYLGLRDLLQERAVLLIEWPDRGEGWLPVPDLVIRLDYAAGGHARELGLEAHSPRGEGIISSLFGK